MHVVTDVNLYYSNKLNFNSPEPSLETETIRYTYYRVY